MWCPPSRVFRLVSSLLPFAFLLLTSRLLSLFRLFLTFPRRSLALRLCLRHVGRGVAELLEHFGRGRAVDAVAFADLSAARAAEAFVERDDCAGTLAVDGLRRLGHGRGMFDRRRGLLGCVLPGSRLGLRVG